MRGYAAWLEHDVARNFLVDGTPFGAVNGAGSNTGNNAVSGINCTRSNTAYPQVDVCLLLDTNMKTSAIDTVANITTSNYTPVISNIIGSNLAASVVVSGISKAAQAVVSYSSGTQPVTGAVFCFYGVSGMTQMNGQCPSVVSSTGSTFTVNLNTTAYSTYVAASGGQTANATAFFSSGTTPQYSLPTNAKFANVEVPFSILSTQSTTTGAAGQKRLNSLCPGCLLRHGRRLRIGHTGDSLGRCLLYAGWRCAQLDGLERRGRWGHACDSRHPLFRESGIGAERRCQRHGRGRQWHNG
jgi:hypothetical protein